MSSDFIKELDRLTDEAIKRIKEEDKRHKENPKYDFVNDKWYDEEDDYGYNIRSEDV